MNRVPLGKICDLQNGRAFKTSEWSDDGVPIIRIQNLNDESRPFNYCQIEVDEKFHIDTGDLLFSWSGTPGTSFGAFFWRRGKAYLNQHIFKVIVDEDAVDKEYLRYALNSQLDQIIAQAHGGVGLKHITKGRLEAIELYLPSRGEQERIVSILNKVDDLWRRRQGGVDLADKFSRSAYLSIFGDPKTNRDSLPVKPLIELVDSSRGISYGVVQRGKDYPGGVPVIRIKDIVRNEFDGSDLAYVDPAISAKYRRTIIIGGELLLSIRGTVGRVAVAPESAIGSNVTREVAVIPLLPEIGREYIRALMLSQGGQHFLAGEVRGVAQRGINLEDVRRLPVPMPPQDKVDKFSAVDKRANEVRARLQRSALQIESLFGSISQRAFAGEL